MRIAIVDDEKEQRAQTTEFIARFAKEENISALADSFSSGEDLNNQLCETGRRPLPADVVA